MAVYVPRRKVLTEKMTPYTDINSQKAQSKLAVIQGVQGLTKNIVAGGAAVISGFQNATKAQTELEAPNVELALGDASRELNQFNFENRSKWGTPEYENLLKQKNNEIYSKYRSEDWTDDSLKSFDESNISNINSLLDSNQKGAFADKLKSNKASAQLLADKSKNDAALYGANGDLDGFVKSMASSRDALEKFASVSMTSGEMDKELYDFDYNAIESFMNSLAEYEPDMALALIESDMFGKMYSDKAIKTALRKKDADTVSEEVKVLESNKSDILKSIKDSGREEPNESELAELTQIDDSIDEYLSPNRPTIDWETPEQAVKNYSNEINTEITSQKENIYKKMAPIAKKAQATKEINAKKLSAEQEIAEVKAFMENPTQDYVESLKLDPRYNTDEEFKKTTDAKQDFFDRYMEVDTKMDSDANVVDVMMDSLKNITLKNGGDYDTRAEFVESVFREMADAKKTGAFSEEDFKKYKDVAQRVLYDEDYRKKLNFLTENAGNYYQDSSWLEKAFGQTGGKREFDSIEQDSKIAQKNAFLSAVSKIDTTNPNSIYEASATYKQAMDREYAKKLQYIGIDIDDLEQKKANKQEPYFYLNGVLMEYVGKDTNGNLLGKDVRGTKSENYMKYLKSLESSKGSENDGKQS